MQENEILTVGLGARAYDIVIGENVLVEAGRFLKPILPGERVVIVTDSNVAPLYLETVTNSLNQEGVTCLPEIIVPAGEASKDFSVYQKICEKILSYGIDRKTTLIALGGGVVGDLTGFLAATLLRGLSFVQIPTSLLAQVDSSVGGKTGINTKYGKNLIGAFFQPLLVLSDIRTLKTLPVRELKAGYAEVVKYGLIDRPNFFNWLLQNGSALLEGNTSLMKYAVYQSCAAKARVVAQDEKEKGVRALLNLGHTFGHAFEAEAGYDGTLLHGEAVSIGMVLAFELSVQLGLATPDDCQKLCHHLKSVGLPIQPVFSCDIEQLYGHMMRDKKVERNTIRFILMKGIGKSFQSNGVAKDVVISLLKAHQSA